MGGGLIIKANIPVQELEGQRGEGAYLREDTVYGVLNFDDAYQKNVFFKIKIIFFPCVLLD